MAFQYEHHTLPMELSNKLHPVASLGTKARTFSIKNVSSMNRARTLQSKASSVKSNARHTANICTFRNINRGITGLPAPLYTRLTPKHRKALLIRGHTNSSLRRSGPVPAGTTDMTGSVVDHSIFLDEVEIKLRGLLLDVAEYIGKSSTVPKPVLRFAGGWVRDKLLGSTSHDIDVAIDNMTGEQFGERLKEYLENSANAEKYGLDGSKKRAAGSLAKIHKNPEASKNLETVTTKIFGLDIDLVNLRKETYTEDSRNPQVEFGSPEEDAERRDATINAMFYNITTGELEDFTRRGLSDMQNKVICTPCDPYVTFKDDPLRILRLIRFASRLGYTIEPATKDKMGNEDIRNFFLAKITKERVWIELEKMLKGPDPRMALSLIDELDLYRTILSKPSGSHYSPNTQNWRETYDLWDTFLRSQDSTHRRLLSTLVTNSDERFLSWFLVHMMPWVDTLDPPPSSITKAPPPLASQVARAAFKPPNQVLTVLESSINHAQKIMQLKDGKEQARDVLGMALRNWGAAWRSQVVFSMLYELFEDPSNKDLIISGYANFVARIEALGLLDAHTFKPLIDGTGLAKALGVRPGPWMKPGLDKVMEWQLRNPDSTDPIAVIEEIKSIGIAQTTAASKIKSTAKSQGGGHAQKKQKKGELTSILLAHFLHETLKPLFSKASKNPEVTAMGPRRTKDKAHEEGLLYDDDEITKPWRSSQNSWALELLAWCCTSVDAQLLEREWGYLIPPAVAVLDDSDPRVRAKGCLMLMQILHICPMSLLKRTGLGSLFEGSLYSSVTYLPSLTPEDDAVALLNSALPAIVMLNDVLYSDRKWDDVDRLRALDMAVRKAILQPYAHAGEHVRIAEVILRHLSSFMEAMRIGTVKHLKDVVPMLAAILSEPLGPSYPPLLAEASVCLRNLVLNAWPRVPAWKGDILKGISVCWIRLEEEEEALCIADEHLRRVREELRLTADVLKIIIERCGGDGEWAADVEKLVQTDKRLEHLLKTT